MRKFSEYLRIILHPRNMDQRIMPSNPSNNVVKLFAKCRQTIGKKEP